MILFEIVLFGIGIQIRVWDTDSYGKSRIYFEFNVGNKCLSFKNKKLSLIFRNFHFHFSFEKHGYGFEIDSSKPKHLDLNIGPFYFHKEFIKSVARETL